MTSGMIYINIKQYIYNINYNKYNNNIIKYNSCVSYNTRIMIKDNNINNNNNTNKYNYTYNNIINNIINIVIKYNKYKHNLIKINIQKSVRVAYAT
jgi:hypothetical protein